MDALKYLKEHVESLNRALQAPCNWHKKFARDHFKRATDELEAHRRSRVSVKDALPPGDDFVLVYSPAYPEGNSMRFRILQGGFVRHCEEVTHRRPLVGLGEAEERGAAR